MKAVALRQFKAGAVASCRSYGRHLHLLLMIGLRDIVVETLDKHSQWLDREEVRDVRKGLGV